MPILKLVTELCRVCGKGEQVYRRNGKPSPYYVCGDCKLALEKKPEELTRHVGRAVEAEYSEKHGAH
jgi:hypothetical protein